MTPTGASKHGRTRNATKGATPTEASEHSGTLREPSEASAQKAGSNARASRAADRTGTPSKHANGQTRRKNPGDDADQGKRVGEASSPEAASSARASRAATQGTTPTGTSESRVLREQPSRAAADRNGRPGKHANGQTRRATQLKTPTGASEHRGRRAGASRADWLTFSLARGSRLETLTATEGHNEKGALAISKQTRERLLSFSSLSLASVWELLLLSISFRTGDLHGLGRLLPGALHHSFLQESQTREQSMVH